MKKIDKLPPELEARLPEIRDYWIHVGLRTDPADRPAAEDAVRRVYKVANLKPPSKILWFGSPRVGAKAAALANNGTDLEKLSEEFVQNADVERQSVESLLNDACFGAHDSYWLAHLLTLGEAIGDDTAKPLEPLADLARAGCGWWWAFEELAILTEPHSVLRRDTEHRLHAEDGPAVAYPDGWSLYYWHGVSVPREWIEDKENLDPQTAISWENIEQRRAAVEIIGWEKILNAFDTRVINEDPDPEIGTLLECDLPDAPKSRFLKVQCGTGRTFVLPVEPHLQTALEANAWTYNLPVDVIKQLEVRT